MPAAKILLPAHLLPTIDPPMPALLQRSIAIACLSLTAACSTTPTGDSAPAKQPAPDTVPLTVARGGLSPQDLAALRDPANPLARRSIYFELDSNAINDAGLTVVSTHGKFLSSRPGVQITVQGNADERGSPEYNLALGQRRADAVRRALESQGVRGEQIDTVSFGSEKPKAGGHNEAAWAENRRADIVYPGE